MENYIIDFENYKKEIKGITILDYISIKIKQGYIYGFVGRNGSGKSMLFKAICGLIKPTSGFVRVNGKVIGKDADFPDDIGILIESPGFLEHISGFDNLKYLASIQNKINDKEIKEAMSIVGLDQNDKRAVNKYSLGMKQRLGIAQAIMENPSLVILDEPMNGLDKQGVEDIRNLILNLKKNGVTILLASHNPDDIKLLCDKVYEIDKGRIESELIGGVD
ncbi:ATP-binding cassette domain-containing protein [Clostridium perfringens]